MFGQVSNGLKIRLRHSRRSVVYNERYDVVRIFSIISEIIETTIQEKRDDAKDESVEAIFQSILRQKNLDIRDKKAAIVDFIAAGIHTVHEIIIPIPLFHFSLPHRSLTSHQLFHFSFSSLLTARKHFGIPVRLDRA